jgi:hypothetical protein
LSESAPVIAPCLIATAPAVELCGSIQGLRAGAAQQPDQRRSILAYKYRRSARSISAERDTNGVRIYAVGQSLARIGSVSVFGEFDLLERRMSARERCGGLVRRA